MSWCGNTPFRGQHLCAHAADRGGADAPVRHAVSRIDPLEWCQHPACTLFPRGNAKGVEKRTHSAAPQQLKGGVCGWLLVVPTSYKLAMCTRWVPRSSCRHGVARTHNTRPTTRRLVNRPFSKRYLQLARLCLVTPARPRRVSCNTKCMAHGCSVGPTLSNINACAWERVRVLLNVEHRTQPACRC